MEVVFTEVDFEVVISKYGYIPQYLNFCCPDSGPQSIWTHFLGRAAWWEWVSHAIQTLTV